jgi:trans-aconitate methyltransferase
MANTARLYTDLAWLWPMWGDPAEEYAQYCRHVAGLIAQHAKHPARTLLDIGCGGGKNVFNLKETFSVTGLDLSPTMLAQARDLNPECAFVQGDMRSFQLNGTTPFRTCRASRTFGRRSIALSRTCAPAACWS